MFALPMMASLSSTMQTFTSLSDSVSVSDSNAHEPCHVYIPSANVSTYHYGLKAILTSSVVKTPSLSLPQFLKEKNAMYSSGYDTI